jgi:hypothetical protein
MKLSVYSPTGTRFEIDVLETSTVWFICFDSDIWVCIVVMLPIMIMYQSLNGLWFSQILNVKDVIAAVSGCNSSTFDLSCNGSSLWIGSSISQQGISESDVLVMIPVPTGSSGGWVCGKLDPFVNYLFPSSLPAEMIVFVFFLLSAISSRLIWLIPSQMIIQ